MKLKVGDVFNRTIELPAPNPVVMEKMNMFWQEFDISYTNRRLAFWQTPAPNDPAHMDTYGYTVLDVSDEVIEFKIEFTGKVNKDGFQETLIPGTATVIDINRVQPAIVRHLFKNKYKMQTPNDFLKN